MENKNDAIYLFHQGTYYQAYEFLGAHPEKNGYVFRTWAPNATRMAVVGDFNGWNNNAHDMHKISDEGLWEVFVENAHQGQMYKFEVTDRNNYARLKADPYGFMHETNGKTASILFDINNYDWHDQGYLNYKNKKNN